MSFKTAAQRKAQSKRMKAIWRKRKAAKAMDIDGMAEIALSRSISDEAGREAINAFGAARLATPMESFMHGVRVLIREEIREMLSRLQ